MRHTHFMLRAYQSLIIIKFLFHVWLSGCDVKHLYDKNLYTCTSKSIDNAYTWGAHMHIGIAFSVSHKASDVFAWQTDESALIFPAKSLSSHITVNEEVEQRVCEQAAERLRGRAAREKSVFMVKEKRQVVICVCHERDCEVQCEVWSYLRCVHTLWHTYS